ncbi:MAG: nucleotidyltransferase family protein [Alphaproteobacteria bacterium]
MCEATPFVDVGPAAIPFQALHLDGFHSGRERRLARLLAGLIAADPFLHDALGCVRRLGLPDAWIGAGAVRRLVWDRLAGHDWPTPLDDVDVLYFEPRELGRRAEADARRRLALWRPAVPWSVKNQARMNRRKGQPAYRDTGDAMRFWLETPTCVAARLDRRGRVRVLAPYGLADLFDGRLRPTAAGRRARSVYQARVAAKGWLRQWPMLRAERRCVDGREATQ